MVYNYINQYRLILLKEKTIMRGNPNQAFINQMFATCPKCGGSLTTIAERQGFDHTSPNLFGGTIINIRTVKTKKCTRCGYIVDGHQY